MSSRKRERKTIVLKMPTHLEILRSIRGKPIPPSRTHQAAKGGKYNRTAHKRNIVKEE